MPFSVRNYVRFTASWLRGVRWTPRRSLIVVAYLVLVPVFELFTWTGLLLDRVFYPRYRQQPVRSPVFIVGNFRSGTTFLHRLMAADRARFTTMKMWEILATALTATARTGRSMNVPRMPAVSPAEA